MAGDRLGIALVYTGTTTLCHPVMKCENVMFDENTSTRVLFENGVNQVSYRGKNGKAPPVKVLYGEEIKWYAIVD